MVVLPTTCPALVTVLSPSVAVAVASTAPLVARVLSPSIATEPMLYDDPSGLSALEPPMATEPTIVPAVAIAASPSIAVAPTTAGIAPDEKSTTLVPPIAHAATMAPAKLTSPVALSPSNPTTALVKVADAVPLIAIDAETDAAWRVGVKSVGRIGSRRDPRYGTLVHPALKCCTHSNHHWSARLGAVLMLHRADVAIAGRCRKAWYAR